MRHCWFQLVTILITTGVRLNRLPVAHNLDSFPNHACNLPTRLTRIKQLMVYSRPDLTGSLRRHQCRLSGGDLRFDLLQSLACSPKLGFQITNLPLLLLDRLNQQRRQSAVVHARASLPFSS